MAATVISFINSKGGVAKTTSAVNIATHLRLKRKKVLIIDLDAQGDASYMLGLTEDDVVDAHIGHALANKDHFKDTIYNVEFYKKDGKKKSKRNISICPGHEDLDQVVSHLSTMVSREMILKTCIDQVKDDYDFIILDCPPNLSTSSINALTASHYYILVVDCEPFAMKNIRPNTKAVVSVQQHLNKDLKLLGVLFTKYNKRLVLHNNITDAISNGFPAFKTKIPLNVDIAEACTMPLCAHSATSHGNIAYKSVTAEILTRVKSKTGM